MFLEITKKRNYKLIDISLKLHQQGIIDPNTYVLDLDTIKENASMLNKEAEGLGMELFFMTKQIGRNPAVANAIVEAGIKKAVAVDPWEAITLSKAGIEIGHVGHLVQIPKNMIRTILKLNPDYITVFSYENAKNISDIANEMGKSQKIFLRIAEENDYIYYGQEGGFTLSRLFEDIKKLEALKAVEIAGLTSFPCLLIKENKPSVTPNVASMQKANEFLKEKGYEHLELNMPSATSTETMRLLKEHGATQGEPGHALTGTTPLHTEDFLKERPAMTYVSEVSHVSNKKAYVFGGGFYPRSHMKCALVGSSSTQLKKVPVLQNEPGHIDYYGTLDTDCVHIGDTAIFAFRTQVFVTHAKIAVIQGLSSSPKLIGIYDSVGNLLSDGQTIDNE